MAVYQYKAISKSTSKTIKGVIDADSLHQARQKLREQELYPTTINETTHAATAETGISLKKHGRISTRDLALMTRQLAVLLRAGMPLVSMLAAVVE
jgi:general secretion pathway protein F